MKLDEHTRRQNLSPSVRIARSEILLFIIAFLRCYKTLSCRALIYTHRNQTTDPNPNLIHLGYYLGANQTS
jgi:hypothetical protein